MQCTAIDKQNEGVAGSIEFETHNFDREYGNCSKDSCVRIKLDYPLLSGEGEKLKQINQAIEKAIYTAIAVDSISGDINTDSLQDVFVQEYFLFRDDFIDPGIVYEFEVNGKISYQSPELISLFYEIYTYTGGAHPMSYQRFVNIDPKIMEVVDLQSRLRKKEQLANEVEQMIRRENDLDSAASWDAYFFTDQFVFPQEMGLTKNGLKLVYNPYEILPFAAGFTEIVIPFDDLKQYLPQDIPDF
jgi:hypothetical protein